MNLAIGNWPPLDTLPPATAPKTLYATLKIHGGVRGPQAGDVTQGLLIAQLGRKSAGARRARQHLMFLCGGRCSVCGSSKRLHFVATRDRLLQLPTLERPGRRTLLYLALALHGGASLFCPTCLRLYRQRLIQSSHPQNPRITTRSA
jgi:hypothetical protein